MLISSLLPKTVVRGAKAVAAVMVASLLVSSCIKPKPSARLVELRRAKDSIELAIAGKRDQAKAVKAAGLHYFQAADSMVQAKMRNLTHEEMRLVHSMVSMGFDAEYRLDTLKEGIARDSSDLRQKCGEIGAEQAAIRREAGAHFINSVFGPSVMFGLAAILAVVMAFPYARPFFRKKEA